MVNKKISIILILISIFSFSACNLGELPDESENKKSSTIILKGTLKSLGNASVNGSNYILETEEKKVIPLKTSDSSLFRADLINKKVEITAYETTDNSPISVFKINVIEELKTPKLNVNSTWMEYISDFNGIKFKRKSNWLPEQDGSIINFYFPREIELKPDEIDGPQMRDKISLERVKKSNEISLENWIGEIYGKTHTFEKSRIEGQEVLVYKRISDNEATIVYIIERYPDLIYRIIFNSLKSANFNNNRNQFFSLVNSLEFIPVSDSSGQTPNVESEISLSPSPLPSAIPSLSPNPGIKPVPSASASPSPAPSTSAPDNYSATISKIRNNINEIAPDVSKTAWNVRQIQFVDPDYAYIEYFDKETRRKLLITYKQTGDDFNHEIIGYFRPGENKDWETASGNNPVAYEERKTYQFNNGESNSPIIIKKGYRYFKSNTYNFTVQYPADWYYGSFGGGGSVRSIYKFSNKPLDDANEVFVSLFLEKNELSNYKTEDLGDNLFYGQYNEKPAYFVKRSKGGLFVISADSKYNDIIKYMAESLEE